MHVNCVLEQCCSKCGPQPTAATTSGNLIELEILRPRCMTPKAETLGMSPSICVLTNSPSNSDATEV